MHKILFWVINMDFKITDAVITPSAFSKYIGEKESIEWHRSTNCRVQESL